MTNASAIECCPYSQSDKMLLDACTFWVEGLLTICVGSFGIFGNLLSISVLFSKEMRKNAFNRLLIILATVDTFLIIFTILDKSLINAFNINMGNIYNYLFPYFIYPTTNIVLCSSIFMVLSIAFERYQAVCNPYEYRVRVNSQSVTTRIGKLTVPAFVLATIINIPKFFETKIVEISVPDLPNHTRIALIITNLRKNPHYINHYVNWFSLLSTWVIPMAALIYFNINIYRKILALKKPRRYMQQQSPQQYQQRQQQPQPQLQQLHLQQQPQPQLMQQQLLQQQQERPETGNNRQEENVPKRDVKMAMILMTIVLVFFSCHLPRVLLNLQEFFMLSKMISCGVLKFCPPIWFLCSITISHLLLVINASVNIIIYCSMGEKFRNCLKIKLRHLQHTLLSSFTSGGGCRNEDNAVIEMPILLYVTDKDRALVQLVPRR